MYLERTSTAVVVVYLDGQLQTTVNELQPDPNKGVNRDVVYATKQLSRASHTLKIVTTTKARFDLDGIVSAEAYAYTS